MTGIDLLWLAGIAVVWYLLGTKRRREQRRHESRPYYVATPVQPSDGTSWLFAFLVVLLIILANHH
jgi:hypothetical protein